MEAAAYADGQYLETSPLEQVRTESQDREGCHPYTLQDDLWRPEERSHELDEGPEE